MTKTFSALLPRILPWLVDETGLRPQQLQQTAQLFDEGGTVPFIARYRKEQTGELDEVQIRTIEERLSYYSELLDRKETILSSIAEQGKLSDELATRIAVTRQKTELEDLYLPYKPKRRTKAIIARERGLEPLADILAAQAATTLTLAELAAPFVAVDKDVPDADAALAGAGHILAERLAEDADVRARVRQLTWDEGIITSRVAPEKVGTVSKFEMYYDYREALKSIPSHRMLAMRRGEVEEVLRLELEAPETAIILALQGRLLKGESVFTPFLCAVASDAYKRLISASIEVELRLEAKKQADAAAIAIFAGNLRNLLLAPPVGNLRVLGVDPGLRTGSKLAVIDDTGKFCEHVTIYPHTGEARVATAKKELLRLIAAHQVEMVAIGNGTAGREMEEFVKATCVEAGLRLPVVAVSEAGASIYSASDIAREEFPDLDLTVRGAISIARRLQDPLAELVKLDAKTIGVGQYQHDVNQAALKKALDAVVESCVNWVGVDLNTASWALLAYVAGIGESLARAIVRYRDENGPFVTRKALLKVPRFGAKAFEQSAGFLRIRGGSDPLDNTAVHPERYPLVKVMAKDLGSSVAVLAKDPVLVAQIDLPRYVTAEVGLPTLRDIVDELKKPGRDPRASFQVATFRDDIKEISDLSEGMLLEGVVTNVTAFGAFVDVGVHQDGLVHVSHLGHRFIRDPNEAVKVGQIVKVKILSVDAPRKRIALSIKEAMPAPVRDSTPPPQRPREKEMKSATSSWEKSGFRIKK
jgi:uncharacterized protein